MRKVELLQQATQSLLQAGIEDASYEARLLLCWALQCDRMALMQLVDIPQEGAERFREALRRRCQREPMAFITGEQGFWTLDLHVSPDTLIPRGDSETLIEVLLDHKQERSDEGTFLDLGTGTGCLLLAALSEYPHAKGIGVDLAWEAAALAARNARRNGLSERASFFAGNWAEALQGCFDVVLSNPPYIEHEDMKALMPEVLQYEPHRALDGGDDGMSAYRLICRALPRLLKKNGCAVLELGIGQEDSVTAIAEEVGLHKVECRKDLGGIPRALLLRQA